MKEIKKYLFNAVALVLVVVTYLMGLADTAKASVSLGALGTLSGTVTFYDMFGDKPEGIAVAIIVLLSVGAAAVIGALTLTFLKKDSFAKYASWAAGLLLVVTGVLYFFIGAAIGDGWSVIAGGIFAGIFAILAGACSVAGTFLNK